MSRILLALLAAANLAPPAVMLGETLISTERATVACTPSPQLADHQEVIR